ncbi:hypothetical protein ESCO_004897 [Escovopsis weberi]|uniref:Uncharacterized protein n=1 Tax=Escovopsis weberi TaxID=150374 RepID=A0A0M9VRU8_ESCWE|nr:hypothetical protein ESCO_004897 [Escovopsis weberi]
MLVDISVYDHTANGEEFLGRVKFEARKEKEAFANFQGFTYVDESALEDQMRFARNRDDEDMDDASPNGHRHDDDDDDERDDDDDDDDDDEEDDDEDGEGGEDEEGWDNLDDLELKKTNRMSGVVNSSSNDEQMVGGSNFELDA